ncbi:MAG TPA: Rrf2 family transcriptional regulator [Hungateiclostridium thermocellum]|jgi:Rrf2 family cysteine metabolism transcriptional repressor|uniref:Transcriptional regulator, BadM/Rrf2 family n=2 Tax=Acetivibrio thermocellus TaxID=1515 RepID=A3DIE7_ACET2|nr:Rrf2 family transcriptional regulator [Acetivibrio thermocellus]ABN53726.1 transcriptional regulator, BadM/Rrf2 family [Acetivibrio thermocellus ATCC 27405]ADU73204.1 transcriptional regulator, BadM/Rrf2 family [Acetivibrio thermocellus DSM 1313]ALX07119.1 transcriptional regulator, BadM/Rrf2 family [Acetivibrio thermocellus AD2]ANV74855.1 transcriptional regulator, BadM/Rrf2 family [Acetivibrio thermocellus DSM 2360]EIC03961.1 transcriptional regulator, Rrf2 family [Acetivibrio thermocellu
MKMSTKGRYGLRAMLDIAVNSKGDIVSVKSIAERQNISESYLEQVFSILRKAAIVKSIKGAQGGYVLADDPSNITVGKILRTLEGNLNVVDIDDRDSEVSKEEKCINEFVWNKINKSIDKVVDNITLGDLLREYQKLEDNSSVMYYI